MNLETNFISSFLMKNPLSQNADVTRGLGISGTDGAQLLNVVNQVGSKLANSAQERAEILPSLMSSTNFCVGDPDMSAEVDNNTFNSYQCEIDKDEVDMILTAIQSSCDFHDEVEDTSTSVKGITLTNAEGYAYDFIPKVDTFVGDAEILIATCNDPASIEDALIYNLNGKYYLNSIVRSKGYWRNGELVSLTTITDKIMSILDWSATDYTNQYISGAIQAIAENAGSTVGADLFTTLCNLCTHLSIGEPASITDGLTRIRLYYYNASLLVETGVTSYYGDIISDVMESDTINQVLLEAIDEIKHNKFTAAGYLQACNTLVPNARSSVRRVMTSVVNAFTAGGVLAAARMILEMISSGTSVVDEDGHLSFTDNNNLVPRQYIAGMICQFIGAFVGVVAAVAMIFSRVIGIIASILSSGLLAIPKLINYDYETAANARVVGLDDPFGTASTVLPTFPYGLWQTEFPKAYCHAIYRQMFEDGMTGFMIQLPGGYLLVGPAADEDRIRVEFHVAVADFITDAFSGGEDITLIQGTGAQRPGAYWCISFYWPWENMINLNQVFRAWSRAKPLELSYNSEGYINDSTQDLKLRVAFMRNMSLAYSYLCLVSYEHEWRMSWLSGSSALLGLVYPEAEGKIMKWFLNDTVVRHEPLYGNKRNFNIIPYLWYSTDDIVAMGEGRYFTFGKVPNADARRFLNNTTAGNVDDIIPSWTDISKLVEYTNTNQSDDTLLRFETMILPHGVRPSQHIDDLWYATVGLPHSGTLFLSRRDFFGNVSDIPTEMNYLVQVPKYDKSTFLFWVGLVTLVTVLAAVVTVISAVKVKKAVALKQAKNAAKVEKAWAAATANPTPENLKEYRSAVFRNNVYSSITGGTKYSKTGFWNDSSSSGGGLSQKIADAKDKLIDSDAQASGAPGTSADINLIHKDITGNDLDRE